MQSAGTATPPMVHDTEPEHIGEPEIVIVFVLFMLMAVQRAPALLMVPVHMAPPVKLIDSDPSAAIVSCSATVMGPELRDLPQRPMMGFGAQALRKRLPKTIGRNAKRTLFDTDSFIAIVRTLSQCVQNL